MKRFVQRSRRGSAAIVMVGVMGVIFVFFMFFLELQTFYDTQYAVEVRAQRAVNGALEYFMDDALRADGYNCLCYDSSGNDRYSIQYADIRGNGLYAFLDDALNITAWSGAKEGGAARYCKDADGNIVYTVTYGERRYTQGYGGPYYHNGSSPNDVASIEVDVTVEMNSWLVRAFNLSQGFQWTQTFRSTNFRTDENARVSSGNIYA